MEFKETVKRAEKHLDLGTRVTKHVEYLEKMMREISDGYSLSPNTRLYGLMHDFNSGEFSREELREKIKPTIDEFKALERKVLETFSEKTEPKFEITDSELYPVTVLEIGENHIKELIADSLIKKLDNEELTKELLFQRDYFRRQKEASRKESSFYTVPLDEEDFE